MRMLFIPSLQGSIKSGLCLSKEIRKLRLSKFHGNSILITRLFTKYFLSKKYDKSLDIFSEKEVFPSTFSEHIPPEAIFEKITVLSFEEFENAISTSTDPNIFFTR